MPRLVSTPLLWHAVAWLGGAVFVISLAYGTFFFAVVLGRPIEWRAARAFWPAVANVMLFTCFALHHSVMARPGAKRWLERHVAPALERSLYVWVASVLFLVVCLGWQPVAGSFWRLDGVWRWLAHAAQAVGLSFVVLGARSLDPLELAGIRAAAGAAPAAPDPSARVEFKTRGPYGIVRHPIYLGAVLLLSATPEMTAGRFLFTSLTIAYVVLAIPWEERSLIARHGSAYREYQRTVRWRVVPGLF